MVDRISKAASGMQKVIRQAVGYAKGTGGFGDHGGVSRFYDQGQTRARLLYRFDVPDTARAPVPHIQPLPVSRPEPSPFSRDQQPPIFRAKPAPAFEETQAFADLYSDPPSTAPRTFSRLAGRVSEQSFASAGAASQALLSSLSLVFEMLFILLGRTRVAGTLVVLAAMLATGVWSFKSKAGLQSMFASKPVEKAADHRTLFEPAMPPPSRPTSAQPVPERPLARAPQRTVTAKALVVPIAPLRAEPRVAIESPRVVAAVVNPGVRQEERAPQRSADPSPAVAPPFIRSPALPAPIYSAGDGDVTPPEPINPGRPNPPRSEGRIDSAQRFEIVVSEMGTVESVRASTPPRTIAELVFLTAGLHVIKSWQFRPAIRDGRPVRYREVMSVAEVDGELTRR